MIENNIISTLRFAASEDSAGEILYAYLDALSVSCISQRAPQTWVFP